jgi:hypothetical protein
MLTAPIYRRYNNRVTPRVPLFKDPASRQNYVNCLIIESDVEGKIPYPIDAMFSRLEGVAREAQALEDYFTEQRRRFRLGEVKRYPRDFEKAPEKYVEGLEKALSGQRWNMVHYIGHSKRAVTGRVDERTMMNVTEAAGYLVLPPREPYPMNRFVDFLKQANTQFLFLSSCEAANYEFLWEASREVPAVLGYRWPVADGDAREFATVFYQKLFEGTRFLEYAFANARREMYDRIKRKTAYRSEQPSVWASPVLLMQIGDNYGQAHAPHGAATWQ